MHTRNSWLVLVALIGSQAVTSSCKRTEPAATAPAVMPTAPPPVVGVPPGSAAAPVPAGAPASRVVVQLTEEGFVPSQILAQAGKPITLAITRKTNKTCAHEILFKGQPGKTDLPLDKEVEVTYTPKAAGTVPFGCAMGMMVGGALEVR
ncbi:MAG: cupredoxin domain-containing protein [Myxococcales bacterium]